MIKLYDYQESAVNELRSMMGKGSKNLILCLPTGGGKTVVFSYMTGKSAFNGMRVMILTDRTELNGQTEETLKNFGVHSEPIKAGRNKINFNTPVFNAMTETLSRRFTKKLENGNLKYPNLFEDLNIDLLIVDECHKAAHYKVIEKFKGTCWILGVTATPVCSNKRKPLNKFYDNIVVASEVQELINIGKLLPSRHFVSDSKINFAQLRKKPNGEFTEDSLNEQYMNSAAYDSVIKAYNEKCNGMKAIVFNCSVAHSLAMTERFKSEGIKAEHLDGETKKTRRKELLFMLDTGQIQVLNSVGTITTGFDSPSVECVILNRAIGIESLYIQCIGRGARTYEGMREFYTLDFGDNFSRFGAFEDARNWKEKFADAKFKKPDGDAPSKMCPECGVIVPAVCMICECGHIFPKKLAKEIQMTEVTEIERKVFPEHLIGKNFRDMSVEQLEEVQQAMDYSKHWTFNQIYPSKDKLIELVKLRGYKPTYIRGHMDRDKKKQRFWE